MTRCRLMGSLGVCSCDISMVDLYGCGALLSQLNVSALLAFPVFPCPPVAIILSVPVSLPGVAPLSDAVGVLLVLPDSEKLPAVLLLDQVKVPSSPVALPVNVVE